MIEKLMTRHYNSTNPICDYVGFAMFANGDFDRTMHYGKYKYYYNGENGVKIEELKIAIIQAWEDYGHSTPDYMNTLTGLQFYECFNPSDIVDDAEAWDNSDFIGFFADFIMTDEKAIILDDGAIVFDSTLIKLI